MVGLILRAVLTILGMKFRSVKASVNEDFFEGYV